MVAMSDRRSVLATPVPALVARIGNAASSSTELNWPPTRTCRLSLPAFSTPAPSTAFCAPSCVITWLKSSPSEARRFWEISMKIFSGCAPNTCTLATSGSFSSFWRTSSARWRSSS